MVFKDKDYRRFVKETCAKYGITLRSDKKTKMGSWIAGNDEVFIGDYDGDEELMAISFAHEVGHTLVSVEFIKSSDFNTLLIELEAWQLGIRYALENFGLIFSDRAIEWGYKKALTYVGHDEREVEGWKFKKILKRTAK